MQAARSTGAEDRQLLEAFLNSAGAGQAGAIAEAKALPTQFLDFQTPRTVRALRDPVAAPSGLPVGVFEARIVAAAAAPDAVLVAGHTGRGPAA